MRGALRHFRPDSGDVRGMGGRPGTGVHQEENPGGLGAGTAGGEDLGAPPKFTEGHVEAMRRLRDGDASLRRIASDFECSASTVLRVLQQDRGGKHGHPFS